jgi:hypothetical protein
VSVTAQSFANDRASATAIGEDPLIVKLSATQRPLGTVRETEVHLPGKIGNDNFSLMKAKRETRVSMREGDRILINKGISKKVFIVARVDVPHSNERVFVTKSGGKYTIGLKVWKSDYTWSEKNQMWVPKH